MIYSIRSGSLTTKVLILCSPLLHETSTDFQKI